MKVAFMASDAIALDCIKMLHAGQCPGFELSCVVSNPDKPKGRGKKMSPNDVSAWAIENGVELMRPEKSPDDSVAGRMRELGVEMIIVMAYGHMLKKNILDYVRRCFRSCAEHRRLRRRWRLEWKRPASALCGLRNAWTQVLFALK